MAAVYTVYTSPNHQTIPNHLPTLIVTPHGQPQNILYSYLHTNFNSENYLLTPSPQGDLCVAKLFPPPRQAKGGAKSSTSDPGHGNGNSGTRVVRCEASRNLKWSIANTGVMSPIYKLSLPSPDSPDLPLFQISKPNPNAPAWTMFYFAYAGHNIPPKRIEFGKIQKNPPGPTGGGTRISITGKTAEEKAVWQTLGEGNEDCVEWVVLCAALNLLDDEILKAAEKSGPAPAPAPAPMKPMSPAPQPAGRGVALRDPGSATPAMRGPPPPMAGKGQPMPRGAPLPQQRPYPPHGAGRGFPAPQGPVAPRGPFPSGSPGPPRGYSGTPPPQGYSGTPPPPNGQVPPHGYLQNPQPTQRVPIMPQAQPGVPHGRF